MSLPFAAAGYHASSPVFYKEIQHATIHAAVACSLAVLDVLLDQRESGFHGADG